MKMSYRELKFYLIVHLDKENFFFRKLCLRVINRAEDILLSRSSRDLNEFAEIIHEEIKEHENPETLLLLRALTTPFVPKNSKTLIADNF